MSETKKIKCERNSCEFLKDGECTLKDPQTYKRESLIDCISFKNKKE